MLECVAYNSLGPGNTSHSENMVYGGTRAVRVWQAGRSNEATGEKSYIALLEDYQNVW
jgi:hypothetical protein